MSRSRSGMDGGRAAGDRSTGLDPSQQRQAWIGVDVSKAPISRMPRGLYPLFAVAVLAALAVAAVRIDLLRTRYAVSTAMERENDLIEEQRQLIVRRRQLRDPVELAVQARQRGFRPPTHVLSLPDPTLGSLESIVGLQPVVAAPAIAAVSAGPVETAPSGSEWQ